jgi:hypothetical protein
MNPTTFEEAIGAGWTQVGDAVNGIYTMQMFDSPTGETRYISVPLAGALSAPTSFISESSGGGFRTLAIVGVLFAAYKMIFSHK